MICVFTEEGVMAQTDKLNFQIKPGLIFRCYLSKICPNYAFMICNTFLPFW